MPMASTDSPPLSYAHDEKGADDIITVHISEQDSKLQLKNTLAVVHENAPNNKTVDTRFQANVQKAEAITTPWSLSALIIAYIVIWLVYFVHSIDRHWSQRCSLPYVTSTSDCAAHSFIPTTGVLSQVGRSSAVLPTHICIAKILDILSRRHGRAHHGSLLQ